MNTKKITATAALLALVTGTTTTASADPCGMVPPPPPLEIATSATIERIGVQKTYVAFDRGIETMVLRPGFQGNVDEFGMLIPFPSPPAIRKVDDNIFSHIAAAIDPPEVIARVQRWRGRRGRLKSTRSKAPGRAMASAGAEQELRFDEVKVVNQEAVGMYEVATLAAGSSKALKRWMDDNSFRYPKGMDTVVDDYVASKWYFVAVKTKVGDKSAVNPRPGMRKVDARRPKGSTFRGFVQAMGFRFRTKRFVVPMRLSVFNAKGNSRNIVYALTRGPSKIQGIPADFVKRQIKGRRLYHNVTNPLPLRVIGGTKADLSDFQKRSLADRRNPTPHNGLAMELFASDMLAMRRGKLSNPLEAKQKALLNIGEALDMRGPQIDTLNRTHIKKELDAMSKKAVARLQTMTLSVIDGAFDRNLLAKQNLQFERYRMVKSRNTKQSYDAIRQGPGVNMGGKLYLWELSSNDHRNDKNSDNEGVAVASTGNGGFGGGNPALPFAVLFGLALLGLGMSRKRFVRPAFAAATVILIGSGIAVAQNTGLTRQLAGKGGDAVAIKIASSGDTGIGQLIAVAGNNRAPVAQGRAIVALTKTGSTRADSALAEIIANSNQPALARTWAAAGRMKLATSATALSALEQLSRSYPATRRTWVKRMGAVLRNARAEDILAAASRVPELRAELQQTMQALPADKLLSAMLTGNNQSIRQQAASFLGTKGKKVGALLAKSLRFNRSAEKTPWAGGPLYLPGVAWTNSDARVVSAHLLRWMLWAEKRGDAQNARIAANNLMSPQLAKAAGYPVPNRQLGYSTDYWVGVWTKTYGSRATRRIINDTK